MAFQGEVGAIGLADVLGNIAANSLAGTLHVTSDRGEAWLSFDAGAVKGFSRGRGKALSGEEIFHLRTAIKEEDLDALGKKKKRTKKSWPEFVEAQGVMKADAFRQLAMNELTENAVEVFFWAPARFEFVDGSPSEELFDPDLGVFLDVNSLVMEAARRRDHWEMINKVIGSQDDIFMRRRPEPPPEKIPEFQKSVYGLCTGGMTLRDIEARTKATRFQVYDAVSELVRSNLLRPLAPDEMVRLAEEHAKASRTAEAIRLYKRSLETEHANVGVREKLAEVYVRHGDAPKAAGEYKQLAHRMMEQGEFDSAIEFYRKAVKLSPDDAPAREKIVQVLKQAGRRDEAATEALKLALLSRKLLLHDRALAALDAAVECNPSLKEAQELRVETLLTLGRKTEAVRQLEAMADRAKGDDAMVAILERAVQIEPARADLKKKIDDVRSGRLHRRRKFFRKLLVSSVFTLVLAAVLGACGWELWARWNYDRVTSDVNQFLMKSEYEPAVRRLREFSRRHPWTLAARRARDESEAIRTFGIVAIQAQIEKAAEGDAEALRAKLAALRAAE
ncbi:MAG: tetratricopeptide repeat protein [Planctomycetes bacterium]|nr:tetratricopeptide repeat protein [Planctomycetota bacterium]